MKKIFAKLKNDQNVILFNETEVENLGEIYKVPQVKLAIPFEIDTRALAENEWYFVILTTEQKEEMFGGYITPGGTEMFNPATVDNYPEMRVIYMVSGDEMFFTKVTSRQIIKSQKYITFGKKPEVAEQTNTIVFNGEVDAYWTGTRLYFKRFSYIRSLFPGIQKIYKELTEEETNEFLSSALFELKEEMSSNFIGLRTRKMIASIIKEGSIDLKDPKVYEKYIEYAKQYDLDLEIADGKIALIDNSDIGKVLSLFGESFYTSEINQEKREIRSSRKLVHGKRKRAK